VLASATTVLQATAGADPCKVLVASSLTGIGLTNSALSVLFENFVYDCGTLRVFLILELSFHIWELLVLSVVWTARDIVTCLRTFSAECSMNCENYCLNELCVGLHLVWWKRVLSSSAKRWLLLLALYFCGRLRSSCKSQQATVFLWLFMLVQIDRDSSVNACSCTRSSRIGKNHKP
jgi:hypothetical protein